MMQWLTGWIFRHSDERDKLLKEIKDYRRQLELLLGQVQEQKGIVDYVLFEKNKEIDALNAEIIELQRSRGEAPLVKLYEKSIKTKPMKTKRRYE